MWKAAIRILSIITFAGPAFGQESRPAPGADAPVSRPAAELSAELVPQCLDAIRRLESDDPAARDQASRDLVKFGPGVRSYVEAAMARASVEGRLRLADVLAELPDNLEPAGLRTEPTRIDLDADGMTVRDALKAIGKKAKVTFPEPLSIDGQATLRLKFEAMPFFEVLDRIAQSIGARWQQDFQGQTFRWYNGNYGRPIVRYKGPFRLSLTNFTRNSTMTFGGEPSEQCYLYGQLDTEPGIDMLGLWTPPTIDAIVDDTGRSLLADQSKQVPMFNAGVGRGNFSFTIPLIVPPSDAKSIKRLAGKFIVAAPEMRQSIVLGLDPAKPAAEVRAKGIGAKVAAVNRTPKQLSVTIELDRQPLVVDERTRQPVQDLEIEWITRSGDERQPAAAHPQSINGKDFLIVAPPPSVNADDVVGIRLRVIAAIKKSALTFEFEDVPLP